MAVELLPKILPNILFRSGKGTLGSLVGLQRYRGGAPLPVGATFARASTASYKDVAGVWQTALANVLRNGHYIGGAPTTLLEGPSTNHFLNSAAPATQTSPSLATGSYTLWMEGTGSIAVAGTTATITGAGTASAGVPVTFVVTVLGTVTYTVTGTPTLAQAENLAFATSYIPTVGASVTRSADNAFVPYTAPPQQMTIYLKFIESGSIKGACRVIQIGATSDATPRLLIQSSAGFYGIRHDSPSIIAVSLAAAPTIGQTVELRGLLNADGSVQIFQSINGAAETSTVTTAANTSAVAWSGQVLNINSINGAGPGYNAFQAVTIAAGIRSLAEMRNY